MFDNGDKICTVLVIKMSSTKKLIIVGILLITLIIFSMILFLIPSIQININGEKNIILNIGDHYEELGASAKIVNIFSAKKAKVLTTGVVNTNKFGKYIITYKAKSNNLTKTAIRVVNVVDKEKPIITLNKEVTLCKNNNIVEIDAKAFDNYDGDITDKIEYKVDNNKVYITVKDSSNNKEEIVEEAKIIDEEKPIIKLNGAKSLYLYVNNSYEELGASAIDSCDGNITDEIVIENGVNTSIAGTYYVTYKVKDSLENETIEKREVIVQEKNKTNIQDEKDDKLKVVNGGYIYLTFDDGPGAYTEQILAILEKYNIKATFFVTNQFPNYQYMIKKEYDAGHTVGIHSYSHKWSIYDSVDAYLDDFNKIFNIVVEQTGVEPKYFRFPGGTSNHVAKIKMSELVKLMTEKGYTYFDWHVDSGDTHGKKATKEYIINMIKTYVTGNKDYIILMHDIKENTLAALPSVIDYCLSNGYTFKVIDENTIPKQFKPYK